MPSTLHNLVRRLALPTVLALASAQAGHAADNTPPPSLEEMQVAGQVLGFLDPSLSGRVTLAVVFDPANSGSRVEAAAIAALLADGASVGALTLQPRLIEQSHLAAANGYNVVFVAGNVDSQILKQALALRRVPCLTRHLEEIEQGGCMVALRTFPSVNIVVNEVNASLGGVRFATAFRMMVQEL